MSIGNLSNSSVPRTMLDDWESLLYLVCWYGTFGVNNNCTDQECKHNINEWCAGNDDAIADKKRSDLNTIEDFRDRIVNGFGKHDANTGDCVILEELATDLHAVLLFHPKLGNPYHGARIPSKKRNLGFLNEDEEYGELGRDVAANTEATEQEPESVDPFEMRAKAEIERKISQDLLRVLGHYANLARRRPQEGR
ncbi:hypothetical protein LPJ59_007021 [Coemansia sp. RSA 2399]|nr:hypothetical protein LPJ59_007021 [Coemansia sp. RSA 2399]